MDKSEQERFTNELNNMTIEEFLMTLTGASINPDLDFETAMLMVTAVRRIEDLQRIHTSVEMAVGFAVYNTVCCLMCNHEWTAVAPTEAEVLECPECGYMNEIDLGVR